MGPLPRGTPEPLCKPRPAEEGEIIRVYLVAGVHPAIEAAGGTRSYVLGLGEALSHRGFEVSLVGAGPPASLDFAEFLPVSSQYPLTNYRFIRQLWAWIRRCRPADGSVVNAMRPDDLYPFSLVAGRCHLVCTLHGNPKRGVAERRTLGRIPYLYAERRALRAADWVISISELTIGEYLERYPELLRKSSVIPIGIDLSVFRPVDQSVARQRFGLDDVPTLLYAGRLATEKRAEIPIEAITKMETGPQLLVAGEGPLERQLRSKASGGRVRFLGTVPHNRMPVLMSAADALVVPSVFEGFPTVALEALACGTPVVASPVGDLPRLLMEGETAFFFDGTVAGLEHVVLQKWDLLAKMRPACIKAAQPFDWKSIVSRVAEVYAHAA